MYSHLEISEHTTAAHKDEHSMQVQRFHCCSAMGCSWFLFWHFPLSGTAVCSSLKSCSTPYSSAAVWWRDLVQLAPLVNAGPCRELEALSREVICKCRLAECVRVYQDLSSTHTATIVLRQPPLSSDPPLYSNLSSPPSSFTRVPISKD